MFIRRSYRVRRGAGQETLHASAHIPTSMVIHFSRVRPNAFGGVTTGTLCNRFQCGEDGMNLTTTETEVTCKLCIRYLVKRPHQQQMT